jgi:ComF family protein
LCTRCLFHLPRTHITDGRHNPVARHFWGKIPLEGAAAYLQYNKGSRVRQLVYNLKYRKRRDVGVYIGRLYGKTLRDLDGFGGVDSIVPVPLHPSRLRSRGFNQSVCFAAGLSESLGVPVDESLLVRSHPTASQTRKHRFERWQNVHRVFALRKRRPANRHFLVVDDVITTGSTAAACAEELLTLPGARVSVAAMAYANQS